MFSKGERFHLFAFKENMAWQQWLPLTCQESDPPFRLYQLAEGFQPHMFMSHRQWRLINIVLRWIM